MKKSTPTRDDLVAEAQANALYLVVYLPVALCVFATLVVGLPYLMFGVLPSAELHGAQIIAWGAYILACLAMTKTVASVVWLRAVRGIISRSQADKIMMPMGRDPIGRWLVVRYFCGGKRGGEDGV
jgi:hypothetical protein